jgi:hypothetical protein
MNSFANDYFAYLCGDKNFRNMILPYKDKDFINEIKIKYK